MKCNVKQAKLTKAYCDVGNSVLSYLDASVGVIVTELYGYKRKRLQEMYNTTHKYLVYMMDQYAEEKDDNKKRAATALKKCKEKLLEYAGFDFDAATAAFPAEDVFWKTWHDEETVKKHLTCLEVEFLLGSVSNDFDVGLENSCVRHL